MSAPDPAPALLARMAQAMDAEPGCRAEPGFEKGRVKYAHTVTLAATETRPRKVLERHRDSYITALGRAKELTAQYKLAAALRVLKDSPPDDLPPVDQPLAKIIMDAYDAAPEARTVHVLDAGRGRLCTLGGLIGALIKEAGL